MLHLIVYIRGINIACGCVKNHNKLCKMTHFVSTRGPTWLELCAEIFEGFPHSRNGKLPEGFLLDLSYPLSRELELPAYIVECHDIAPVYPEAHPQHLLFFHAQHRKGVPYNLF